MSTQVKADPKAIAARQGKGVNVRDPKVIAARRRLQEIHRQATAWRKEHVLGHVK